MLVRDSSAFSFNTDTDGEGAVPEPTAFRIVELELGELATEALPFTGLPGSEDRSTDDEHDEPPFINSCIKFGLSSPSSEAKACFSFLPSVL